MKTPNPKKASQQINKRHIKALDEVYQLSDCRDENKLKLAFEGIAYLEKIVEGNGETLGKDNPVPSLDKLKNNIYQEFFNETIWENDFFKEKLDKIFTEYQNGVETNKVRPITITKCMCDEPICKCSFF